MMKSVLVLLDGDMPDTELEKVASVTIGDRLYTGKVGAVIAYAVVVPKETSVTISGPGLKTVTPPAPA